MAPTSILVDLENAVDLQNKQRPRKTNQSGGFGSQTRCTLLRSKRGSLSLASAAHSIGARHFKTLRPALVQASRRLFQSPQAPGRMEGTRGKRVAVQRRKFNCFPLLVCMFTYCGCTWMPMKDDIIQRSFCRKPCRPATTHHPPPATHQPLAPDD